MHQDVPEPSLLLTVKLSHYFVSLQDYANQTQVLAATSLALPSSKQPPLLILSWVVFSVSTVLLYPSGHVIYPEGLL
jgi:hypothetical protein